MTSRASIDKQHKEQIKTLATIRTSFDQKAQRKLRALLKELRRSGEVAHVCFPKLTQAGVEFQD
jgi:hemerythrin